MPVVDPTAAKNPVGMHAEAVGDGNAPVIVGSAAPLGANHTSSHKGPVEQGCDRSGDYSSSFGSGLEPATDLADTPGCIERDEHDPADQNRVIPNSVDSSTVRRASVRVAAQGGAGAINGIRDERRPDPRSDVLPSPIKMSCELHGMPHLERPKLNAISYDRCKHITPLICTNSAIKV